MKTQVLTLLFCIVAISSQAQWTYRFTSSQKHSLYTSGDYIVGETNGGNLGLFYVYNNKYSINIGYSATTKSDSPLPREILKSGSDLAPMNNNQPFQNFENIHIMVGRSFSFTKNDAIRVLLQGGPSISNYREPVYNVVGNSYGYEMQTKKKLSFTLNPRVEVPLCCNIGVSAGPMLVVNNTQKYFGLGIGVIYGILQNN